MWAGPLQVILSLVQLTVGQAKSAQASSPILLHVLSRHILHAVVHLIVHCQPLIDHRVRTLHSLRGVNVDSVQLVLHHLVHFTVSWCNTSAESTGAFLMLGSARLAVLQQKGCC